MSCAANDFGSRPRSMSNSKAASSTIDDDIILSVNRSTILCFASPTAELVSTAGCFGAKKNIDAFLPQTIPHELLLPPHEAHAHHSLRRRPHLVNLRQHLVPHVSTLGRDAHGSDHELMSLRLDPMQEPLQRMRDMLESLLSPQGTALPFI